MSEEKKPDQAPDTTPTISDKDIRASEVFRTATSNAKAKTDAVQAELDALKASIADKAKADRDAALKAQGNYEALEAELRAEIANMQAAHAAELLQRDLSLALTQEFSDQYFVAAKVAAYEGDPTGIAEYVTALKADESNARYLVGYTPEPAGATPPVGSTPAARSTGTSLADRLQSEDPGVKLDALKEQLSAQIAGKLPV